MLKEDGYEQIYNVIQPYCPGKKEFYLYVDTLKFAMLLEKADEISYFIDDEHNASPIRNHDLLRIYWTPQEDIVRIYTLHEAADSVKKLIG